MPTSRIDRFNKLFEGDQLPLPPEKDEPRVPDTEAWGGLEARSPPRSARVNSLPSRQQMQACISNNARMGRTVSYDDSDHDDYDDDDDDDDEYVRAFSQKGTPSTQKKHKETKPALAARHQASKAAPLRGTHRSTANDDITDNHSINLDDSIKPLSGRFCLFGLVTKFCYKYMDDPDDCISKKFFAAGKIWQREWDLKYRNVPAHTRFLALLSSLWVTVVERKLTSINLPLTWCFFHAALIMSNDIDSFYLHPPVSISGKALLLVPEKQVRKLIAEVESAFHTVIDVPGHPFLLSFYEDGTPLPTKLGSSHSREDVAILERAIPAPSPEHGECPLEASSEMKVSFQKFRRKMEQATAIGKRKSTTKKVTKAEDRLQARHREVVALHRCQRFLGLRTKDHGSITSLAEQPFGSSLQRKTIDGQSIEQGCDISSISISDPAPYSFDQDVVFIAVDVETCERKHNLITEIGISALDTADIKHKAPGAGGSEWMQYVRSRHFRIREHAHIRNIRFCVGDPERFLFGSSEFVDIQEIGAVVDSCFQPPYSFDLHGAELINELPVHAESSLHSTNSQLPISSEEAVTDSPRSTIKPTGPLAAGNPDPQRAQSTSVVTKATSELREEVSEDLIAREPPRTASIPGVTNIHRNVILVGHDLDADLRCLSNLNSAIFSNPPSVIYPQPFKAEHPLRSCILHSLDTAKLYQAWRAEDDETNNGNKPSLAKVLMACERPAWCLHNAGNDARYTMEALVGIAVKSRSEGAEREGW